MTRSLPSTVIAANVATQGPRASTRGAEGTHALRRTIALSAAFAAFAAVPDAQARGATVPPAAILPPADECARDVGFVRFRAKLLATVARRDARGLLALVADDIKFNFGGGTGAQAFAAEWTLDRPATSALWHELGAALRLGCARQGNAMVVPHLFVRFPERLDPFGYVLTLAPHSVRAAPRSTGARVPVPRWSLLRTARSGGGGSWIPVTVSGGRKAYARRTDVRSPVDYRAFFERRNGRWRMTLFVAGD